MATNTLSYYPNENEIGISTSCNSGNDLFSAWWNSIANQIFYKWVPNNQFQFKPTGIDTSDATILNYSVYPNPASNFLEIKYQGFQIKKVRIINSSGQVVLHSDYEKKTINIASLPSGNYFISIQAASGQIETQPFVKMN